MIVPIISKAKDGIYWVLNKYTVNSLKEYVLVNINKTSLHQHLSL